MSYDSESETISVLKGIFGTLFVIFLVGMLTVGGVVAKDYLDNLVAERNCLAQTAHNYCDARGLQYLGLDEVADVKIDGFECQAWPFDGRNSRVFGFTSVEEARCNP